MPKAGYVQRVFHVELKTDIKDYPVDTYFLSKKALFDFFGNDLGLSYNSASVRNFAKTPYENARCIIKEGILRTAKKKQNGEVCERTKMLTEFFKDK